MQTKIHARTKTRFALLALLGLTACSHGAWAATTFCVSNDSEFAAAAATATVVPVTIELVQGTYNLDVTAFGDNSNVTFQGFSLLGGYTSGCASRQIDPANTIISSHAGTNSTVFADVVGDVTAEGLTFQGQYDSGLWLVWNSDYNAIADSVNVVLRRNIFAGPGNGIQLTWRVDSSHTFAARLVNNLVHDYVDGTGNCTLDFLTDSGDDATFTLINNTVVDNDASPGTVCLRGGGNLYAYNNIFYGGTSKDLYSTTSHLNLFNNVIGTHSYPGTLFNIGTLTGDPSLNSSFHPIQSPPSPVINSGDNTVPGGLPANDLDGGARIVGSTVDRGAYESNVDDAFILSVTNNNDSGPGSLRQAIISANSNGGFNIIEFAIGSGCGPHTITLQSQLPAITSDMLINGYTQTGSAENDLDVGDDAVFCIVLDGGTHNIADGLNVPTGPIWVKGLAFSGFTNAAIDLQGGSGHVIEGVRIGGSTSGGSLDPVRDGIDVGLAVSNVTIGGSDNGKRNVIGDTLNDGVFLAGGSNTIAPSHDNQIINNYIGVGWNPNTSRFTNLGNGQLGVRVIGRNNTISGNTVGFNFLSGIQLLDTDAHGNTINGNYIGISPSGDNLGNPFGGVSVTTDAHDNSLSNNTIADNGHAGIAIVSGQHNLISANSMHDNGALGIDLGGDGITPNDNDSTPPSGDPPNRLQNFPVLTSAIGGHFKGTLNGMLTSTPGDYRIELFGSPTCDASGNGQGYFYLGHTTITLPNLTVNGQTTVSFSKSSDGFFQIFPFITATATAKADGVFNDTSEFSACFPYTDDTIFANGFDPGIF